MQKEKIKNVMEFVVIVIFFYYFLNDIVWKLMIKGDVSKFNWVFLLLAVMITVFVFGLFKD